LTHDGLRSQLPVLDKQCTTSSRIQVTPILGYWLLDYSHSTQLASIGWLPSFEP